MKIVVGGPHAAEGVATEVVLPPGWQPGQPALLMVFLHDGWGSEKSFRKHDLAAVALGMMQGGAIPPVVIASPRHRGTFIVDSPRGQMESFVAEDLVPAIEREFPGAGGSRDRRSVWGISLGGYGALKMALRHPGVYGRVAALAPWVQPLAWDSYEGNRTIWSRWFLEPVFGHSREESRFDPQAVSSAGAVGLMQKMPATAAMLAAELKLEDYDLRDPADSLLLGAAYLAKMLDRFHGNLALALAGYNAGPGNARLWVASFNILPPDVWLLLKPFDETRRYIIRVVGSYYRYRQLYGGG
ncbi:MAG: transglycosylase SLT domain-containing protein [bacterium]|nr:transglycosylase SLT domain-containing protein [bacterium]